MYAHFCLDFVSGWASITHLLPTGFRKFGKTAIGFLKSTGRDSQIEDVHTQPFPKPVTGLKRFTMGTLTLEGVIEKTLTEFMLSTENEHNWLNRQTLLKQLNQVFQEKPSVPRWAWDKMKLVMSRIIATAASERTQLSKQACETIGILFQASGTDMHAYLELTLPTILQLCGSAKKQNQVNGNNTMKTIIQFSGYHKSLLHHICSTFSDKRKDARALAPAWLTQFLNTYKDVLDTTKDLPIIERALAVGLVDSDVKTREGTRETFWRYHGINEVAADAIMNTLNPHAASALRADKHNPNRSSAPAKAAARPESALAKIRAQSKQKAAEGHGHGHGHTQAEAKRDVSNSSVFTKDYPFRPIEGLNEYLRDPNPKPEYGLNEQAQRKLRDEHKALVKASIRDESTPIYELQGQDELRKKASKHRLDGAHESKAADARHLADTCTNARPFLSAPVRRPRVVATPITHDKPGSRSMTKAEATRKAEQQKARAQPHRGGRHTPTIPEETQTEAPVRPSTKAHKSWAQSEQNPVPGTSYSSSSRPTSSSSEPVAIKSPKGHTQQSASISVLAHQPGKAVAAGSEFSGSSSWDVFPKVSKRVANGTTAPKLGSPDATFSSPKKASPPFSPGSFLEGSATSKAPAAEAHLDLQRRIEAAQASNQLVDFSKLRTISPPEHAIIPIAAQENTVQSPGKGKVGATADEGLANARHTLPKVIEAVKEGRLDALGYRKLRKLLLTYPGQLFTGVGADETYTGLYIALVNHFANNERPGEAAKQASHNHSMYTSMAIIDMVQLLITQYPYGEPQAGMTLIALMMVKAGQTLAPQVDDKIRSSMLLFVNEILERFDPLAVMDAISDAMEAKNGKLLDTAVFVQTKLVVGARERGYVLDEGHQQRLADLLRVCLLRMRPSSKRQAMQFATVLFDTIKPEERFRALFGEESDLNLIYYCIGKVRERQAGPAEVAGGAREEGSEM
ncbi:hypothetical protein DV737_g5746, partial [Chaetothyriales sp. CBS 132003]